MNETSFQLNGAVIGYGGAFNMGRHHALQMKQAGFGFAAVCELDPGRLAQAAADFPGIRTYSRVEDMLAEPDIGLVTVITPHHTHAPLAKQVLESGKHCIVEKPMCIRVDDAHELVGLARQKGVMLSVYHNRRWDGWLLTVQDLAQRGLLGDIFHAEFYFGGFGHPGHWWRSDKRISGGAFYDFGAHYMDAMLQLVPGRMRSVRGYAQKRLWHDVTNEDQLDCLIEFDSGAVVHAQSSSIARAGKAVRRILGTKGAVVSTEDSPRHLTLHRELDGQQVEIKVPLLEDDWQAYYRNVAEHLLRGGELAVKPEQARRVIAVLDTAGRSAEERRELPVSYEDERDE